MIKKKIDRKNIFFYNDVETAIISLMAMTILVHGVVSFLIVEFE